MRNTLIYRRTLISASCSILAALLLASCGGGSGGEPSTAKTDTVAGSTVAASSVVNVASSTSATELAAVGPVANVKEYGARCDWNGSSGTDDTAAIQSAINAISAAGGGTVSFPAGGCVATSLTGKNKVTFQGAGKDLSQLVHKSSASSRLLDFDSGTSATANNFTSVNFYDMAFVNYNGTFSEYIHLIALNGVSNAVFDRVLVKGFRGDGIYLGGGGSGSAARHNQNIIIRNSVFDGVNNQNRNAVSIIDCDGCTIQNNQFKNTSLQSMPGPIDIEPNYASAVVRNITIQNNTFNRNGGGRLICVWTPSFAMTVPMANIFIRNNNFAADNTTDSAAFTFQAGETVSSSLNPMNIVFEGNTVSSPAEGFTAEYVRGIKILNNTFNGTSISELGKTSTSELTVMDAEIAGNKFNGSSNADGVLLVATVKNVDIYGNTFTPKASNSTALHFKGSGVMTSSNAILIHDNTFVKGASQLSQAVKVTSHSFAQSTNRYYGNVNVGGTFWNQFLYQ